MKKLLALVLALVMTMGLATVGTNAAFTDQAKVDASDFAEAITVLNGMGIFRGDENGNFNPDAYIDRASTAAMIYRLYTGDTADAQTDIYAGYGHFTDLTLDWYKGYIGYCANAEFIKGDGAGHFMPGEKVTGYQALAMVLRAMGYNKQNDFTGDDWELRVAETAQQRGLVQNISATTLRQPATRALVAEIIWEACWAATVEWTPALGYSIYVNSGVTGGAGLITNDTLGWKNFGLTWGVYNAVDKWMRPGYGYWDGRNNAVVNRAPAANGGYALFPYEPTLTYTEPVAECDVVHDLGRSSDWTATAYVNCETAQTYRFRATAVNTYIGGQGRLTEIYNIPAEAMKRWDRTAVNAETDAIKNGIQRVVMIDTFLAEVTGVTAPTFDRNNHLITPALLTVDIYTQGRPGVVAAPTGWVTRILEGGRTPFTYAVGDYILLNAYTDDTTDALNNVSAAAPNAGADVYVVPFAANAATLNRTGSAADFACAWAYGGWTIEAGTYDILGTAESFVGSQTVLGFNNSTHTIGGKVYKDALEFHLDDAKAQVGNFTWFLDQYGNLIGSAQIATQYTYGVITSIWWVPDATTGGGYAAATVVYMDGTTETVKIATINLGDTLNADGVNDTLTLVRDQTAADSEMVPTVMGALNVLPVSTFAYANAVADVNAVGAQAFLGRDMFRFNKLGNGSLVAVETGFFANSGEVATAFNKLLAQNIGVANTGASNSVVTNDNTVFLVRNADGTFSSYTGRSNLPTSYANAPVDYANTNADAFAEFVFIRGADVAGTVLGRFYLTSPTYTWELEADGVTVRNYLLTGIFNGVQGTLVIPARLGDGVMGSALVDAIINAYTTNPGSAWILETRGNRVVNGLNAQAIDDNGDVYDIAADTRIIKIVGAAGDTRNGNVYTDASTGVYYSNADVTPLVGTWAADMSTKNVVLVINPATNVIKEAYIFDRATGIPGGSGDRTPTYRTDRVTWTLHVTAGGVTTVVGNQAYNVTASSDAAFKVSAMVAAESALRNAFGYTAGTYTIYAANINGTGTYTVTGGANVNGDIYVVFG